MRERKEGGGESLKQYDEKLCMRPDRESERRKDVAVVKLWQIGRLIGADCKMLTHSRRGEKWTQARCSWWKWEVISNGRGHVESCNFCLLKLLQKSWWVVGSVVAQQQHSALWHRNVRVPISAIASVSLLGPPERNMVGGWSCVNLLKIMCFAQVYTAPVNFNSLWVSQS